MRGAARQQNLRGPKPALGCLDLVASAGGGSQARHRRMLVDLDAAPRRRFRKAADEAPDMHAGALAVDQPAVIALRSHFAGQLGAAHHRRVGIDIGGEQFLAARQLVIVLRFGRELDLADAREAAVDLLFRHQALDRIDPGVEGPVEPVGDFLTELGRERAVVLGEPVIAHAAVPAGRRVPDRLGFEEHDARALLGESQGGRRAGQAAADHRNVAGALHRSCGGAPEWLRCVQPIGCELHIDLGISLSECWACANRGGATLFENLPAAHSRPLSFDCVASRGDDIVQLVL